MQVQELLVYNLQIWSHVCTSTSVFMLLKTINVTVDDTMLYNFDVVVLVTTITAVDWLDCFAKDAVKFELFVLVISYLNYIQKFAPPFPTPFLHVLTRIYSVKPRKLTNLPPVCVHVVYSKCEN